MSTTIYRGVDRLARTNVVERRNVRIQQQEDGVDHRFTVQLGGVLPLERQLQLTNCLA